MKRNGTGGGRRGAGALLALAVSLGACVDRAPTEAPPPTGPSLQRIACAVTVATGAVRCAEEAAGPRTNIIVGGQGSLVRLSADSVSYDGSAAFRADVTVENLLAQPLGTPDGTTVYGVNVFFADGPAVTGGSGSVSVANADGTGTFLGSGTPYFHYGEIVQPRSLSTAKRWIFSVPATVTSFSFSVYVETQLPVEQGTLRWIREAGGLPTPGALSAVSPTAIFGASSGTLSRWDGAGWSLFPGVVLDAGSFVDVVATSPRHAIAATSLGALYRFDGAGWSQVRARASGLPAGPLSGKGSRFVQIGSRANAVTGLSEIVFSRSADGGLTWSEVQVGGPENLAGRDVEVLGDTVWALAEYRGSTNTIVVLRSVDGGATWSQTSYPQIAGLTLAADLAVSGDSAYVVAYRTAGSVFTSVVMRTHDGFATWDTTVVPGRLREAWRAPTGEVFLTSGDVVGTAISAISTDGGASFDVDSMAGGGFSEIAGTSATNVFSGRYRWDGSAWTDVSQGTGPAFPRAGAVISDLTGRGQGPVYGGGYDDATKAGIVWVRSGSGWVELNHTRNSRSTSLQRRVEGLWVLGDTLWAVGWQDRTGQYDPVEAVLRRSTDGGSAWDTQVRSSGWSAMYDVWGTGGGDTLFAVGKARTDGEQPYNATILRSVDAGVTWTQTDLRVPGDGSSHEYQAVTGWGAQRAWAAGYTGSQGFVSRTLDGGATWSTVAVPGASRLVALWAAGPDTVFAGGYRSSGGLQTRLYRSVNAGASWTEVPSGISGAIAALWGTSTSDLYAAGGGGLLLHYDGVRWARLDSGTTNDLYAMWGRSPGDVFAAGHGVSLHGVR